MTKPSPFYTALHNFAWNTSSFAVAVFLISLLNVGITVDNWTSVFWAGMVLFIISRSPVGLQADHWVALFLGTLVVGFASVFKRPFLVLIGLPLFFFAAGMSLLMINGAILRVLPGYISGFHVGSFWAAVFDSFLLSFITGVFRFLSGPKTKIVVKSQAIRPVRTQSEDEVIDI